MTHRIRAGWAVALVVVALVVPVGVAGTAAPVAADPPSATDPGTAGPRPVEELSYDLGDEAFAPQGFGARIELRGKVYAPADGAEAAPLVVLLHGRHATCGGTDQTVSGRWPCPPGVPEIPSYRGYDALGRNLASHGNVVVSIGANGINANDGFLDDGGADARAQLVMETLRRWQAWGTASAGSPFGDRFVGRIDTSRVALMGHSRGGEGVVAAANLNQSVGSPFGIRAVLALAPVDFARRILGAVPLGVVLPDCDGDVSDLQGADYYDDARYVAPEDPAPRSVFHVRGANHNWFNTVWTTGPGSGDDAEWGGRYECRAAAPGRLSAPQQNTAGAALMSGYLRRYLLDQEGFQRLVTGTAPFPASVGPARWTTSHWAPQRLVVERWDTAATSRRSADGLVVPAPTGTPAVVCNPSGANRFFPSRALTQVACPEAGWSQFVNDTGVFDLGWTSRGTVVRRPLAPGGVDVTGYDGLRFRAAGGDDSRDRVRGATLDLTVVLEDATGARASARLGQWSPALTGPRYSHPANVVLSGVRIPLTAFAGVDLTRVRAVEIRPDRTDAGRVRLADLAFTAEGVADAAAPALPTPTPVAVPPCRRTAGERVACAVSQVLWGRDLEPAELGPVLPLTTTVAGRKALVTWLLATPEALGLRLQQHASRLTQANLEPLNLAALVSPAGRRSWEAALDEVAAKLRGTPGYSSAPQVVDGLYETYGTTAQGAGRTYWIGQLDGGGSPTVLARTLRRSLPQRQALVTERYREILGYGPDASSLAYWSGRIGDDGGERALVAALMGTERFRLLALSPS